MKFLLVAINAKYIHSNPGIYSLKTYADGMNIKSGDIQVEIAEYTINNQMELILEDIYRRQPDAVGFSCYIWNIWDARNLVHDLHKVLPKTDIWMGGPEVSFDAPKLLAEEPEILGVMKGEGEETFLSLMQAYAISGKSIRSFGEKNREMEKELEVLRRFWSALSEIPSLTYRTLSGEIYDNIVRPVMDMSKIPFLYSNLEGFENRIIYYESSRGCPFSCSYCLSSIDKSVRFRDLELVKQELKFFLDHKVPQVKFVDRTFNCKKSHAMEIWQYLLEHDNGVTNFHFEIAADLLGEDELALIRKMRPGLIQLEIGVQSTNPATIQEIHRKMNVERVREIVAKIDEGHNVHQHLDLIAGLPFEDYKTFANSFNDVYAMHPEQLQMGFLKVLKGSYMYDRVADYDLEYRELPPYEVLSTRWLPYSDVLRLKTIEDMVEVYYNSGQFPNTLMYLEKEFASAFAMFEAIAFFYEKNNLLGRNHTRIARFEILHDFIAEQKLTAFTIEAYEDALITDMYLRENCKSRPAFALDQFPWKEKIKTLVPELRHLGTQIHVEAMRSGEIWMFDYRTRDALTRNAVRLRLE